MDNPKELVWIASSKKDLIAFPEAVQKAVGYALWIAQMGEMPLNAKVLHGFTGASVLEIRTEHEGNTYRAVYTVRFAEFVYVLHAFQKKSKKGNKTPANIMEVVRKRLKAAEKDYEKWRSKKRPRIEAERSSGNVFLDLGLAEPDVLLAKSKLIAKLHASIEQRHLSEEDAAKLFGVSPSDLAGMLRGDLDRYPINQIESFLKLLDHVS